MKKFFVVRYDGIDYVLESAQYQNEYPAHSFASNSVEECHKYVEENYYCENVRGFDFRNI